MKPDELRSSAAIALLFVTAFAVIEPPANAAAPPDLCAAYPHQVAASTFIVPAGTTQVLEQSTTIKAASVQILGVLKTSDAHPGTDAPSLCIQTSNLTVAGVLCTGNGADGEPAQGEAARGGNGTRGGTLALDFVANGSMAPSLSVLPGAVLCTGAGGNGGSAFASDSYKGVMILTLLQAIHGPDCSNPGPLHFNNKRSNRLDEMLTTDKACHDAQDVVDALTDPTGYLCASNKVCGVPAACSLPGASNLPECGGSIPKPCNDSAINQLPVVCGGSPPPVCSLPGVSTVPVVCGQLPQPCAYPAVNQVPVVCSNPCTLSNCLNEVLDPVLQVVNEVYQLIGNVCPSGVSSPASVCGVPLCDGSSSALAFGGSGGASGALDLNAPASLLAGLPRPAFHVGHGGNGGNAEARGDGAEAVGGSGGPSLALVNGNPWQDSGLLGSGTGGSGGQASATGVNCHGTCSVDDPYSCAVPCGPPWESSWATCVDYWFQAQGTGADGPPDPKSGVPGNPGRPGDPGHNPVWGLGGISPDPPAIGCVVDVPTTSGGNGWPGDSGHEVKAKGGNGDSGPLYGGNGGWAHATAANGQVGGSGGHGGYGVTTQLPNPCPTQYCGGGGIGGAGGDASSGDAQGGKGGYGPLKGGKGGDATGTRGAGGEGGMGGSGGLQFYSERAGPDFTRILDQCYGGCGGFGGATLNVTATYGDGGESLNPAGYGKHGTNSTAGPDVGTRGFQGLPGLKQPDVCPKQTE